MKRVVQDASVLIDLAAADLLEAWFGLAIETLTSSFVWREVNRRSQKAKLRAFARDDRIQVVDMGAEVLKHQQNRMGVVPMAAWPLNFSANFSEISKEMANFAKVLGIPRIWDKDSSEAWPQTLDSASGRVIGH